MLTTTPEEVNSGDLRLRCHHRQAPAVPPARAVEGGEWSDRQPGLRQAELGTRQGRPVRGERLEAAGDERRTRSPALLPRQRRRAAGTGGTRDARPGAGVVARLR